MSIKIITLMEDREPSDKELKNEHGLSFYIEKDENCLLFDTGESEDFIYNAEKLGLDLNKVKDVVLSHGHHDHTGGFRKFVEKFGKDFILHVKPDLFDPKYNVSVVPYKFNGNNFDVEYIVNEKINIDYVVKDVKEIVEDVFLVSSFMDNNEVEKIKHDFARRYGEDYVIDSFSDELCIVIKTSKGLVVLIGCSHPGVMNMLDTIKKEFNLPIYYVIGGTHLVKEDDVRINATFDYFVENNVQNIGLCHCTGENAIKKFSTLGDRFFYNEVGTNIVID